MEEMGIRGRKRVKKVRGDEMGQALSSREEKRRGLYWARAAAQLEHPCPRFSAAPCLHCELHCSCSNSLLLTGDKKLSFVESLQSESTRRSSRVLRFFFLLLAAKKILK